MFDPTTGIDAFFDMFGQSSTINGEAVTIIVDDTFVLVGNGDGRQTEERSIQAHARTADLEALATTVDHDSLLVTGSTTYRVYGIRPDGAGMTTLILEEQ